MSAAAAITIRAAEASDVAAIVGLARGNPEIGHWTEEQYLQAIEFTEEFVERCVWVAETDEHVAGFLVAMHLEGESATELENLLVAAPMRRRGIAAGLCEELLQWTLTRGANAMALEVRESNTGAIAFYERLGFAASGRRPGYYRDPEEDALTMVREVPAAGRE